MPSIIVRQKGVVIPGVEAQRGLSSSSVRFDHPLGVVVPEFFEAELRPLGATASIVDGVDSLDFLRKLSLSLGTRRTSDEDEELPRADLGRYERDADDLPGASLTIVAAEPVDVVRYWSTGEAYYELELSGELPKRDWTLDVEAEFRGALGL